MAEPPSFLTAKQRKDKNLYRAIDKKFRCQYCESFFTRNYDCVIHEKTFHQIRQIFSCVHCDDFFFTNNELLQHMDIHSDSSVSFKLHKSVFNGAAEIFRKTIFTQESKPDPFLIFADVNLLREITNIMIHQTIKRKSCLFTFIAHSVFVKFNDAGDISEKIPYVINTGSVKINFAFSRRTMLTILRQKINEVDTRLQDFSENGSGWTLIDIPFIDLSFASTKAIRGGCGVHYSKTQGLINIKNTDEYCLLYCILAFFYRNAFVGEAKYKASSYEPLLSRFSYDNGASFPISPDKIGELEEDDGHQLPPFKINVFVEKDNEVFPIRSAILDDDDTRDPMGETHSIINVLLVEGFDTLSQKRLYHYILIDSPSNFIRKRYNKNSRSNQVACKKCFTAFRSMERLVLHESLCGTKSKGILCFEQNPEKKIKYEKAWRHFPHILAGFLDFESLVKKSDGENQYCTECCETQAISCQHSYTFHSHHHSAINYTFILVDRDMDVVYERYYTGEDAVEDLFHNLYCLMPRIRSLINQVQDMDFTEKDRRNFEKARVCHICMKKFEADDEDGEKEKVRDHCHVTGKFLGAAHSSCNLFRREMSLVKIFAHNFSGYDSHLLISNLHKSDFNDISAVPKSGEKFLSLTLDKFFCFVDSMSFLPGSLDTLIKTLPENHDFLILKQSSFVIANCHTEEMFKKLLGKWKFPYELAQSIKDLEDRTEFPTHEEFKNSLTESNISIEEYNESRQLYHEFNFKNLKEYMEIYCLLDVFLLAEVFNLFRKQSLLNFGIDPCAYLSLPGLSLDCFLRHTEVELDYIQDGM